jgi:ferredoxin/coenzyme F420-reducing hydrogenase delta subunit
MKAVEAPSSGALAAWNRVERGFDRAFGASGNPLRQLGALGFLTLWVLAVSGVWLYAVLDTSASGAYESIERLSQAPWSPGGLMRSLHRYATDAFVIVVVLHLLREVLHGRFRRFRRFSWLTGIGLLPLAAASGIGGFWLNWDQLGQFSATATAEWVDALPLLAAPLARNFLSAATVTDRLFSLFVFVHLGVALMLLFGLWIHIQRLTRAAVFPPRALGSGTLGALLALAVLAPVTTPLSLDWVVLFVHPLMYATSASFTWLLTLGVFGALLALPFLPAAVPRLGSVATAAPVALVDAANCNGCRRCFADCPYAAITMVAHPDGHRGKELAFVDPDKCAGCGICAGSCPSSTPFRSTAELVSGIDMPQHPVGDLRARLRTRLASTAADRPIVVFSCLQGADADTLGLPDVITLPLICTGQLPPSFVEYALRDGAAGVLVASCRDGGCAFRLGAALTTERLAGLREPTLRASVPRERVTRLECGAGEESLLGNALLRLRGRLPCGTATARTPRRPRTVRHD